VCAEECPVDAITMHLESEMTQEQKNDEQPRERGN